MASATMRFLDVVMHPTRQIIMLVGPIVQSCFTIRLDCFYYLCND